MTRPRCDAHVHVWDPAVRDHSWLAAEDPLLRRRFDLDDYARDATPGPDDQVVLVQVLADLDESVETLGDAAGADLVAGVVGWVDLEAPDVADRLARLADGPGGEKLVGVRHLVQSEPDPHWLARRAVRRGLGAVARAGLTYDLLVRPRQLGAATDVARALPDARYVEWILESFGPARLMFGSDWPVCTAEATFAEVVALAHDTLASLSEAEADAFLSGTAHKAYALPRATAGA